MRHCGLFRQRAGRDGTVSVWGRYCATGLLTLYFSQFPSSLPLKSLFAALVCGALSALVAVTVAHFVTGVTPTFDSSLAEGAATITGTNSSTINPEQLSLGMLLFRALGNGWGLLP